MLTTFICYILGELLFLANSDPPLPQKRAFYSMKNTILERWASVVEVDLQHIVKPCYYCNGTGWVTRNKYGADDVLYARFEVCPRCGRTGKYDEFWVYLFRYRLGGHEFHSPFLRTRLPVEAVSISGAKIEGYITHSHPSYYLSAEAFYWLALMFDFDLFRLRFGRTGYPARKFTPMVILSDIIFRSRFVFRDLFYRNEVPF